MLKHADIGAPDWRAQSLAMRHITSWARPAAAVDCAAGVHKPSRAALRSEGGEISTRCTQCGCQLVKNPVTRTWYVSGLMG